jgi:hypothetical protein
MTVDVVLLDEIELLHSEIQKLQERNRLLLADNEHLRSVAIAPTAPRTAKHDSMIGVETRNDYS